MRSVTAAAVAGVGLLLTLAALLDRRPGLGDEGLAVRVSFAVPDVLVVTSAVTFVLAGVVVLTIARQRRKFDEDVDPEPEALRMPWWARALLEVFFLLPLIVIAAVLWLDGGRVAAALLALGRSWFGDPGALLPGDAETPVVSLPWLGWSVGLLALAVALATLGLALALLFGERLVAWWQARRDAADVAEPLLEAVDDSLDDLADEPDPRAGIIKCYRRFEHAAAGARVPRARWQTPEEFMQDALTRLPLPHLAVERLTRLFELARFSHHPLRPVERDLARECLEEIRAALAARDDRVAVA